MKYLLDVNALISLGFLEHEFHRRMSAWVTTLDPEIATCAITELGFVRVLATAPAYGITITQARQILEHLKNAQKFEFLVDDHDISRLPRWVKTGRQTTGGHLAELARAHGVTLATLDERIRGAFLIPAPPAPAEDRRTARLGSKIRRNEKTVTVAR
jgi:predicted nucleic acid-binding protein